MSGKVVGWAFEQDLTPTQKLVLLGYADNAQDDGKCWPSKQTIIAKTGLSQASVYRAVGELRKKGLLEVGEDDRKRECVWLAVSHSENGSSRGENGFSQGESPSTDEPSEEPSKNHDALVAAGFRTFLDYHERVTGDKPPGPKTKAIRDIAASFVARRNEGYSLDDLFAAVDAAFADPFRREHGHYGLESVLRPKKINGLVTKGRRLRANGTGPEDDIDARNIASLRAQGLHEEADELERG